VLVSGQPAATIADQFMVAGCVFVLPGGKPQPCIKAQWLVPAARVFINGQPAILQTSTGVCLSAEQAPQGAPMITASQIRVSGL
jgi:hypothetical protein